MFKVMIVDDEILTRIGIASMYNWNENGFMIVAEADNGKDALEIAEREQPDIILTDIKMPVMNGIELIRNARQRGLKAKFVILSSYSEFEYVREGMKLGAEDYLLKLELEPDKLVELLIRISEKIRAENTVRASSGASRKVYKISHEHAKSRCIYNILTGWYDSSKDIEDQLESAGLSIGRKNLVLIVIQNLKQLRGQNTPGRGNMPFSIDNAILKALNELVKNYGPGHGCIIEKHLYCMVTSLKNVLTPAFQDTQYLKIKADITEHIKNTFGADLSVYISTPTNDFTGLPLLFQQLFTFSGGKYHLNGISMNSAVQDRESDPNFAFGEELIEIERVLNNFCLDKLNPAFANLINKAKTPGAVNTKMLYGTCHTLIHIIDGFISKNTYLEHNWSKSTELLSLIKNCKTHDDYILYIQSLNRKLARFISSNKDCKTIILKAKQFIEHNYHKNISLESAALHVNLSTAYFSRLFGQETGMSFIDYLTGVRIEHAKELLKNTNKKVQEISENIGYNNPYYFSRIFKKVTGIPPLQYRK